MPVVSEDFSGGLVTTRDPAVLQPGELVQSDNAVYLPGDLAIQKAKLRTKYNAVAAGAAGNIKGLRYLEFEDRISLLAAHEASSVFLSTFSAETGTFATLPALTGMGSGDTLDAINYGNRYILINGTVANQIVRPDGTARRQGMNPVTELPPGNVTIVSGIFNASLGTGFFHFLTTEVFSDIINGEEIESGFVGTARTASSGLTTPASQAYQIAQPTVVNSSLATHWRVYMAGPTTDATPIPNINEFRLVTSGPGVDINTTTVTIGNATGVASRLPGTVAGVSFTNPTFITTDNNTGATSSTESATLTATNFGFSGITGTITGFQVFVKLKITDFTSSKGRPAIIAQLTANAGTTLFPNNLTSRKINLLATSGMNGNYSIITFGSSNDLWTRTGSPAWPLTDVNGNINFGVKITYGRSYNDTNTMPTVDIDYVKIGIFTTGNTQPVDLLGRPFRVINVSVAGITTSYTADGPPPVASTGDIFEGQLVLNDTQDLSIIRYSLPEKVESYPEIYFLNFETKTQDIVTCIRRLGNKLIIGMQRQLYRINYLPRETDAEFDRGRSYETISESEGIVGPQAATLFSPDGETLFLAYISHSGPRYTDGFQANNLNNDLDWENLVRLPTVSDVTNYLKTAIFVDYPAKSQLWFYYTAPGSTTNNRAIVFHYSRYHRKQNGTFKATGPITVSAFSAHTGRLAGNDVLLTGQSGGFVYVEDRGFSDASGGTPLFNVRTREMYLGGIGKETTIEKVYTRHRQDATSTVTVTISARRQDSAQFAATAKTFTTAQAGTSENAIHMGGDSHQIRFEETANGGFGIRLTGYSLDVTEHGETEKR